MEDVMEISVKLRQTKNADGKIAAYADVVLDGPDGRIQINSFSVFRENGDKKAWVAPPATKGEKKFFPIVSLSGEIRKRVEAAIMAEYGRLGKVAA
jgi:DNA-binding cell septation regulator SpoVG